MGMRPRTRQFMTRNKGASDAAEFVLPPIPLAHSLRNIRGHWCCCRQICHHRCARGQPTGWDSMWQRFMTRLLKDTDIKERFTEHHLRGKVCSDEASIERAIARSRQQRDYKAALSTQARNHQARPLIRDYTRVIRIDDTRKSRAFRASHAHSMFPRADGGGRTMIRPCFALGEKQQLLPIEWGKF